MFAAVGSGGRDARASAGSWRDGALIACGGGFRLALLPALLLLSAPGRRAGGVAGFPLLAVGDSRCFALLLIPLVRFGPRYPMLALNLSPNWSDVRWSGQPRRGRDSEFAVAAGDTLFVWGYRRTIYVYTRMPAATRFLESQPLSGVLADRHLFDTTTIPAPWTRDHRAELARSRPEFVVDGLKLYNPRWQWKLTKTWAAGWPVPGSCAHARLRDLPSPEMKRPVP